MLRHFVNTEQGSLLSYEIWKLLECYIEKSIRPKELVKTKQVYDINFFQKLIPYSVLARELVKKFIDTPANAFDFQGNPDPEWDRPSEFELNDRRKSCMFAISRSSHLMIAKNSKLQGGNLYENEIDIRRYKPLYMHKINEENLDVLMA